MVWSGGQDCLLHVYGTSTRKEPIAEKKKKKNRLLEHRLLRRPCSPLLYTDACDVDPGSVWLYFWTLLFFNYLFSYYFWLHWVFDAACRLSPAVASGGYALVVV